MLEDDADSAVDSFRAVKPAIELGLDEIDRFLAFSRAGAISQHVWPRRQSRSTANLPRLPQVHRLRHILICGLQIVAVPRTPWQPSSAAPWTWSTLRSVLQRLARCQAALFISVRREARLGDRSIALLPACLEAARSWQLRAQQHRRNRLREGRCGNEVLE